MWTVESENMLLLWGEKSQYYKLLYEQASLINIQRDKWFGVPLIILGCVVTSAAYMQLDSCGIYQRIITGSLALLFTIMTAIGKSLGVNEVGIQFYETAKSYDDVVMDIQEQLSRQRQDRLPMSDFVATIKVSLKKLKRAPVIPDAVLKNYVKDVDKHFKSLGICVNDTTGVDRNDNKNLTRQNSKLKKYMHSSSKLKCQIPDVGTGPDDVLITINEIPEEVNSPPCITKINLDNDDAFGKNMYDAMSLRSKAYLSMM
jgi:hypothetical protein